MSENRVAYGLVGVIKSSLSKEEIENLQDELWENDFGINHERTLIYYKAFDEEEYKFSLHIGETSDVDDFITDCEECFGITVDRETVKPFFSLWYDGCDSPFDKLKFSDFNNCI